MRRQNRSCDQCRKAKKACDAALSPELQRGSTSDVSSAADGSLDGGNIGVRSRTPSCSYCLKTRKRCTFRWLQSQLQSKSAVSQSIPGTDRGRPSLGRQGRHTHVLPRRPLASEQFDLGSTPLSRLPETPQGDNGPYSWDPIIPDLNLPVLPDPSFDNAFPEGVGLDTGLPGADFSAGHIHGITGDPRYPTGTDVDGIIYATSQYGPSENELADPFNPNWNLGYGNSTDLNSTYSSSQYNKAGCRDIVPARQRRQSYYSSQYSSTPAPSLSFFSAEQSMMDRSNNSAISWNLLRIYHDVVEYSLACWLTENTCPYKIRQWNIGASPGLLRAPETTTSEGNPRPTPQEWSPDWANRIYARVIKLDKVAQSTKLLQLTRAEDRAASKALRLAIMAFATQWAQKSQRAEEQYEQSTDEDDLGAGLAEEFDRTIQRSLWDQARRALRSCAELETFRVVCAEVIFSWTQKPWEEDDVPPEQNDNAGDVGTIRNSLMSQLEDIISKDGLPVFLERAARKMRALKFRFDAHDAGLNVNGGYSDTQDSQPGDTLDSEDRGTVGLLYWLTVMADTISSSMHERPVVLTDKDCQHDDIKDPTSTALVDTARNKAHSPRWGLEMFIQDDPTSPLQSARWPCSHDDAAWAVQKSVSVKVVLWRHIAYLQNSLRDRSRGPPVEDIIHSAMLVYRYWDATYGIFFRDLVDDYDAVPPRLRGWFVCIDAHWHLAALMFADLLSFVDENDLGVQSASQERASTQMAEVMRNKSAKELAELSRVSTPARADGSGDSPAPQMPDFHFAINAGTILTEPWTIILVRAYAKAYVIHFARADELWRHDKAALGRTSQDCQESLQRCEDCIRALWFLGKKSDISRGVAKALTRALRALEACISSNMRQPAYGSGTGSGGLPGYGMGGPALVV